MEYTIKEAADVLGIKIIGNSRRANDTFSILLTDSRRLSFPEKSLFFALCTQNDDGHCYVEDLYRRKVRYFVVSRRISDFRKMPDACFLMVSDTQAALQALAVYHRRHFSLPIIGITGSNGKTVVKEFLYQLLQHDYNIVRSPRSYNSQLGVPLSVGEINEKHTLGIFEAGISHCGEMPILQYIIEPNIGILTNIGDAHRENFNSTAQKCIEKFRLFAKSEVIIYNGDSDLLNDLLIDTNLAYKAIGWSRTNAKASLFVRKVVKEAGTTALHCVMDGATRVFTIPFTDDASIENVLHCIALMHYLKPSSLDDTDKFRHLEPVDMRLDIKQGINNCLLINDTYNSDYNSLDIALSFQQNRQVESGMSRTLILSDILQTGMPPEVLYEKVAELVSQRRVDRLVGIGSAISACSEYFTSFYTEFYPTTEAFLASGGSRNFQNELILVKGARPFRFEQITASLEQKRHETILEVNLDALEKNLNHYRTLIPPDTKVVCMVKAFGYGAGALEIAKTLQTQRCDYLAVALTDEGEELRRAGISIPVMVMNPELGSFNMLFDNHLEPEVYSFRILDALIRETRRRGITEYPIHLKFDTGMHRLGFDARKDIPAIVQRLKEQNGLHLRSIFSHLAGSDEPELDAFTLKQINDFRLAAQALQETLGYTPLRHILNTAGIERFPKSAMDMVRLGIGLYGISPSGNSEGVQNVCTLRTTILQIRELPADETVGYNCKTTLEQPSRIAVIPIGYADGFNRHLGNRNGQVLLNGTRCPIVGNICMDTCMIDVTEAEAHEGDTVTLFGDGLPITEIAERLQTIPYEILTSISPRVKRVYYR